MNDPTQPSTASDEERGLYVLQIIGDDLSEVAEGVRSLIGTPERIEVAPNESSGPNYVPTAEDWDSSLRRLREGTLAAAIIRTSTPGIRFGLVTAPNVFGGRLSQWVGTVDFAAPAQDWRTVWSTVLRDERLLAASLSLDDGIELSDEQLSVDRFPWEESRLVVAAVRGADGTWMTRENPKPSW
jgi:hypothetical protein